MQHHDRPWNNKVSRTTWNKYQRFYKCTLYLLIFCLELERSVSGKKNKVTLLAVFTFKL